MVIRKLGPRNFLSAIILSWGVALIGMAFCKTWQQLAGIRALLGFLESGYFPGALYLQSCWYSRYEIQKRFSMFFILACIVSGLAGIMTYGFSRMAGLQGLSGWQWIYIMEAILTFIVGIICAIFVVDFPEKAHKTWGFLKGPETEFILRRLNRDRDDAEGEPFNIWKFLKPGLDIKIWCFGLLFFSFTTVAYALSYFLPTILVAGMGFGTTAAQCLLAPPYVLSGVHMNFSAWFSDKYRTRGPVIVFNAIIAIVGLALVGFAKPSGVRLFGVFLAAMGSNANIAAAPAYQANNTRGQWTRAFSSSLMVAMGGVGGVAGSLVFRSQDAPEYIPGIWATIASQFLVIVIVVGLSIWFRYRNKQAENGVKFIADLATFRYTI
ncbi:hypothetical protein AJ78_04975 [Emergomyces pasteurianus Ep9510]|uniref:Major facilitator superfamily (MFS) profile domain-containing protein n=1 Tax=Emergomyces pasteurianus Ep9510 TaxID=1447872 RepID=A0A1J9PDP1_9EURO|nr:hypothetical protein AJ78_04975 [Emergomyces pasteurianus Ep9510]